jgi:hypothetical protein
LELAPGELLAAAAGRGAQLEGITTVLLLTGEDDFNALASTVLGPSVDGPVHRLRPDRHDHGVVAPYTAGMTLFAPELTRPVIAERIVHGARILQRSATDARSDGADLLFVVRADGRLIPVGGDAPESEPGDNLVLLSSAMPQPRSAVPAEQSVATADSREV